MRLAHRVHVVQFRTPVFHFPLSHAVLTSSTLSTFMTYLHRRCFASLSSSLDVHALVAVFLWQPRSTLRVASIFNPMYSALKSITMLLNLYNTPPCMLYTQVYNPFRESKCRLAPPSAPCKLPPTANVPCPRCQCQSIVTPSLDRVARYLQPYLPQDSYFLLQHLRPRAAHHSHSASVPSPQPTPPGVPRTRHLPKAP